MNFKAQLFRLCFFFWGTKEKREIHSLKYFSTIFLVLCVLHISIFTKITVEFEKNIMRIKVY